MTFPDREVIDAILGICKFGARIGYEGERNSITIHKNLTSALENPDLVTKDIETELEKNRLEYYPNLNSLPRDFVASPLGLTDKSDGSKRRIHHLSFPTNKESSINSQIPEQYGTIVYGTVSEAIAAIQNFGQGCQLVKWDLESAFRHIPVSPLDRPLLGLKWESRYYAERYLPFGLRTAPYLFNLFAEIFHWILADQFSITKMPVEIVHYLDDFLIVLPPDGNLTTYSQKFAQLCSIVGLSIKEAKSEEGTISTFGGIELDSEKMIIRLPERKLYKAKNLVQEAISNNSLSLFELQRLTGYLNFVSIVTPLGRAFLRRLYNMQIYFPGGGNQCRKRISSEAKKDLNWWLRALNNVPERSIKHLERERVLVWMDASGTKGLGGFYMEECRHRASGERIERTIGCTCINEPKQGAAFSISIPRHIARQHQHINTKEMHVVEQALLYWGRKWSRKRVIMHIDNQAVVHALKNQTIRYATMTVLRRCLLLATEYDLEFEARWIPTSDNALANGLSRFNYEKVTNVAPQLIYPTCTLRDRGFLMYSKPHYLP